LGRKADGFTEVALNWFLWTRRFLESDEVLIRG
jgi:hypothetical protein